MTAKAVFLDTSVLPRDPNGNQDSRVLKELVDAGIIEVHTSTIVVREWTTQRQIEFEKKFSDAISAVDSIKRHPWASSISGVDEIATSLAPTLEEARKVSQAKCEEFFDQLGCQLVGIEPAAAESAFSSYFEGLPPFGSIKNRKDIPDAFIFEALKTVAENQPVLVAINDGRLADAADSLDNVTVFPDIKNLVASLQPQLDEHKQFQSLMALLKADQPSLLTELQTLAENQFDGMEICHSEIPEDNSSATINGYYTIDDVDFDWDKVEDYGTGWLSIPFEFTVELDLFFYVYRSDAFDVPEWVHVSIGDFENDHYFEAEGTKQFTFTGMLSAKFSAEEIEDGSWPEDFEVDDLEITDD